MAFLEEEDNLQNTAVWVDYSTKFPTVYWNKLWILTTSSNEPIQLSTWSIDISNVWTLQLKSYLKDWEYISWSWTTFASLNKFASVWGKFCASDNLGCTDTNSPTLQIADIFEIDQI